MLFAHGSYQRISQSKPNEDKMKYLETQENAWKALQIHVSKDSSREALCGISLEPKDADTWTFTATDGHTLLSIDAEIYLMREALKKMFGPLIPEDLAEKCVLFLPKNKAGKVPGIVFPRSFPDYPDPITYPNWRNVVPQHFENDVSRGFQANPDYPVFSFEALKKIHDTRKFIGGDVRGGMHPKQWNSCVGATLWETGWIPDYILLAMPMRVDRKFD
jgi:hypothetical protein